MSFYETLTAAIEFFTEHGYSNPESLAFWQEKLRQAAQASLLSQDKLQEFLAQTYRAMYAKLVDRQQILRFHQGVGKFTLERVRPQLRAELDRRILASADLIVLNREDAIATTLRRFSGWATSIPAGGSDAVDKTDTKTAIKKSLSNLPFIERRVATDQGHKFRASLNSILASDGGALAARWESKHSPGYNNRKDHLARDGKIYVLPNNWALAQGLMKLDGHEYTTDITEPASEVYCSCRYVYIYNLRSLPASMITEKGRAALEEARRKMS